ncbi:MAG: 3-deoxy-D-manno-octulosonic acid kinase [Opitutales bacterium]|jgi:3-deoxy-D-manno-octulosonic acid kinase|nr:3-deoxy-D-manno-octulosonic acid kinase [bacterium]MDG2169929.1 3-deoxy-D-manno-octulosonic acid kinase [Opitutales bacterium]
MADSTESVFFHPRYADLSEELKGIMFDPEALQKAGLIFRELKGRGTTYFYHLEKQPVVLRHYWRGGFMQNLSKDAYIWTGLSRTRSYREWKLLEKMKDLGLPTPGPVALQISRSGFCYRSDIVTEEIEEAESLAEILKQRPATSDEWQLVGGTIKRFHESQVLHADLNANNILLGNSSCYWIDFDRGRIQVGDSWKASVIARLRRSLEKLQGKHDVFNFTENGWDELLKAYVNPSNPAEI